ncbi:MAG: hypothetical protein CBE26_00230 [Kiritimatiellaceae bacterium TMED266]|nr:MAG: hypothetical protein CBE26_00230 [Kiritimatiellaceae bacterium TMED266]
MERPIYAGPKPGNRTRRWRTVFGIIVIIQLIVLALYLYQRKQSTIEPPTTSQPAQQQPTTIQSNSEPLISEKPLPNQSAPSPASLNQLSLVEQALQNGQIELAYERIQPLLTQPSSSVIEALGQINIQRLHSALPMDGKIFYTVQSGDYLQKIARQYNTTIALIKSMNSMQTDTIRIGARLLVFNGSFSIQVSKNKNTLDLLLNNQLFKRYPVGTGEFGKTPAVEFFIYDKIIDPPWTRPTDNRLIEYGDPENVLGTRWMALKSTDNSNLKGFGIHGTWERDSIGSQSSAGCVRMFNEDVEELFDIVPRKSRVTIIE